MTVRLVPLEQLTPAPWNPRRIDKARLHNLAESIRADPNFLLRRPILAQQSGEIYAGNQRWHAAKLLFSQGWTPPWDTQTVPVDLDDVSPQLARERALRDNNAWGAWDDDSLARLLGDLRDAGSDTGLLGFDDRELSQLLARLGTGKELNPDDADLTPPVDPITKPGDLWILGDHRLLCGDALSESDMARLTGGERVSICLTDPPYNVGVEYGEFTNDRRDAGEYTAWSHAWLRLARKCATCVVFTPGVVNASMWYALEPPTWACAWRKVNQQSPSALHGYSTWEPLLVYGRPAKAIGHDSWDIPVVSNGGDIGNHPVPKTVTAWGAFCEAFTEPGDLVLDVFAGAGTTVIVAEQQGRRCDALEIEPAYCDVIVRRWERVSGQKAVLQRGG
jgi:hypothetical protein